MRRLLAIGLTLLTGAAVLAASATGDDTHTYFIEADNAFGIVNGSEVKVSGVQQGVVDDLDINASKRAVIKVTLSGPLAQLGEDSICSFEPQSLIAEYFIDCITKGAPLEENSGSDEDRFANPDIPVEQTRQTVQNDLVQSGLRQSYKERLQILLNEFGTALAGNPENLNDAIRRGAPALTSARKVTRILADQNKIIRNLNENSDVIMAELADRRKDVRKFVEEARDTAAISAERREDLSTNFDQLDDFLAELDPTLAELDKLAVSQTPLLRDLRASAGGLADLTEDLPAFNRASTASLTSLGDAAQVGERALGKGADELAQLAESVKNSVSVADNLAKFLRDIDDPDRAVEVDARAAVDTGRSEPTGYTGLEGLLNYVYYQAGALNQYDEISHLLHFSIFEVGEGPCSGYNNGPTVPAADGGETTELLEADRCVAWLGNNQPGINQEVDVPPYDPAVCPDGSADEELCDPDGASTTSAPDRDRGRDLAKAAKGAKSVRGSKSGNGGGSGGNGGGNGLPGLDNLPGDAGDIGGSIRKGLNDALRDTGAGKDLPGGLGRRSGSAGGTRDLLGFLFDN